jgi:hypothetical protein
MMDFGKSGLINNNFKNNSCITILSKEINILIIQYTVFFTFMLLKLESNIKNLF